MVVLGRRRKRLRTIGAAGGTPGADGSVWHDGSGAPGGGLGVNGDYYLDTDNGDVYTKSGGSWSVTGNILGPTGATGATGPAGPAPSGTGIVAVSSGTLTAPRTITGTANEIAVTNGDGAAGNPTLKLDTPLVPYLQMNASKYGIIYPVTVPVNGDHAWHNQTSGGQTATVTVGTNGEIYLTCVGTGAAHNRVRDKAVPGATPWTFTICIRDIALNVNNQECGLALRDNGATPKLVLFVLDRNATNTQLILQKWTSATAFSASYKTVTFTHDGPLWLQVTDNGTNLIFRYSKDGVNFIQFESRARGDFLTTAPTHAGYFLDNTNASNEAGVVLYSWSGI